MSDPKIDELLKKNGMGSMTYESDRVAVALILKQLKAAKLMEAGNFIGGASVKSAALLNAAYEDIIVQQNLIIIRQLDRISAMLYDVVKNK